MARLQRLPGAAFAAHSSMAVVAGGLALLRAADVAPVAPPAPLPAPVSFFAGAAPVAAQPFAAASGNAGRTAVMQARFARTAPKAD